MFLSLDDASFNAVIKAMNTVVSSWNVSIWNHLFFSLHWIFSSSTSQLLILFFQNSFRKRQKHERGAIKCNCVSRFCFFLQCFQINWFEKKKKIHFLCWNKHWEMAHCIFSNKCLSMYAIGVNLDRLTEA